ncbi:amidohydrolase family protein [Rhodococcus sp. ACT016]|uniref:amidohydrolase family protein n=1 Tax=Rhodococcus sp. ACT016 TaxID=3134808 RepID=UPI003D2D8390
MHIHDLVLTGGRVVDPETGLDAVRNLAITGGTISALSPSPVHGRTTIDVSGRVVCPGFIDLHSHGQAIAEQRLQAMDGVTTALELEAGVVPVATAYARAAAEGRPVNYGYATSWAHARMIELSGARADGDIHTMLEHAGDARWQQADSGDRLSKVLDRLYADIEAGALGIGVVLGYAPNTDPREYLAVADLAARAGVSTFTHARALIDADPTTLVDGATEIVQAAAETGAHMHYCHVNSTSNQHIDRVLSLVEKCRNGGATVTTEAYPYGSGSTAVGAAFLAPELLYRMKLTPQSLTYVSTGERIPDADHLRHLRSVDPGGLVVVEFLDDDDSHDRQYLERALTFPDTAIASDAMPLTWPGRENADPMTWPLPSETSGHPRGAGTYARTFRTLVRERGLLDLDEAVRRCSLVPAQILEASVPAMHRKGRLSPGNDADIVVFDPDTITDRATYIAGTRPSSGIDHVLVAGTPVVRDGHLVTDALPGRPVRRG